MKLELDFMVELPENWIAVDAVAVIKTLDQNGTPSLCIRSTQGIFPWDSVGMLTAGLDAARGHIQRLFVAGEDIE